MRFHAHHLPPHGDHRFPFWGYPLALLAAALLIFGILRLREQRAHGFSPPSDFMLEVPDWAPDRSRITDELIESIILIESAGDPRRVGAAGERGLMQIRRETWREVTRKHHGRAVSFDLAFDPDWNRRVGRWYLADLQEFLYRHRDEWRADPRLLLLAAYNGGPDRLRRAGFDLQRLPAPVRDYALRGASLHDSRLAPEEAAALRSLLNAQYVD